MRTITLPKTKLVALIDDKDFERISRFQWQLHDGRKKYASCQIKINGKYTRLLMHHAVIGRPKRGFETDHKDRNGLNNQRHNLRQAMHSQNCQNRGASRNGPKGVYFDGPERRKPWRAQIHVNGIKKRLGRFLTESEAAQAYNLAASFYHGEFAVLNPS